MNIRFDVIYIFSLVLTITSLGTTEVVYKSQPVTITASRLFSSFSGDTRMVYVIDTKEIQRMPVESVQDVLRYVNGIDLSARGEHVQTDFSLRGCSFEQILVLLDGVCLNDPQTGHHNSDIPVSIQDIERIEVLAGHGSSLYGPDSFGGVIHIITKQAHQSQSQIGLSGGSTNSFNGYLSQSVVLGTFLNRVSIDKQKSDGTYWDTDYDNTSISWRFHSRSAKNEISGTFGYLDKAFGANGFYGPAPSREKTSTVHGNIRFLHALNSTFIIQSKLHYRYHRDRFNLDYLNPERYQNDTRTWVGGVESQFNLRLSEKKEFGFGVETVREEAKSTKWGSQILYRGGGWIEMLTPVFREMVVHGGVRFDRHEKWGIQISPSFGLSYAIQPHIRLRASAGRVFRAPTFTELFYRDDYNQGNASLKPETGWSAEAGLIYDQNRNRAEITFFFRDEKDRIQWVRKNGEIVWQAENISLAQTTGIAIAQEVTVNEQFHLSGYYTTMVRDQALSSSYESKYSSEMVRHHIKLSASLYWPWKISQNVFINFRKYEKKSAFIVVDAKWSRRFGKWNFYLNLTNLSGTDYEEIVGVPMPGRQMILGTELTL